MSWQLVVLVKPLQDELPDHEVLTGSNNARLPKSRTSLQTDICLLGAPVFPPPCPAVLEGKARINFSPTYEIGTFHCPFFYDSGLGSFPTQGPQSIKGRSIDAHISFLGALVRHVVSLSYNSTQPNPTLQQYYVEAHVNVGNHRDVVLVRCSNIVLLTLSTTTAAATPSRLG